MSVEGCTAIVTGATEGIGRTTSELLAERGARVVLVARGVDKGKELEAALGSDRAAFLAADVADPGTPARAVELAQSRFGSLDILVNNAAMDHTRPLLEVTLDEIDAVLKVNFVGALRMLQASAQAMKSGGAIVNVTSRLAYVGAAGFGLYSAAKGALVSLTRSAAIELAPMGIRVNAVAPGLTATPLIEAWVDEQEDPKSFRAGLEQSIPQRRLAQPQDIANAIVFLAGEESAHITGTSLSVDGGYTAQ